ncbi:MAG: hypothetical protein ABF969_12025 [Sporolactobacillus sp.]
MNMDRFREPSAPSKSDLLEEQERLLTERQELEERINEIDDRIDEVQSILFAAPGA